MNIGRSRRRRAAAALPRGTAAAGAGGRSRRAGTRLVRARNRRVRIRRAGSRNGLRQPFAPVDQWRLAGRQPMGLGGLPTALLFGPRPADEALRVLDEVDGPESRVSQRRCGERGSWRCSAVSTKRGPSRSQRPSTYGSSTATTRPTSRSARSPLSREITERRRIGSAARAAPGSRVGSRALLSTLRAEARPLAVRARPLRRSRAAGRARARAGGRAGLRHADVLAAGQGARVRPIEVSTARPSDWRVNRYRSTEATDGLNDQAEAYYYLAEVLAEAGRSPTTRSRRSSKRSTASSARRTWPWSRR